MNDNFLTNCNGSCSIEIHSRTNTIGMPLKINNDVHIMSTNTKEIIDFESFQNNSQMSISYDSNSWSKRNIYNMNGKFLLISRGVEPKF